MHPFGPDWETMAGPDHPQWRERERVVPWSARVPEYRYTITGAVLGVVRIATVYIPIVSDAFRKWEDRHMYDIERRLPPQNRVGGGAYDFENGPNRRMLQQWRSRMANVQKLLDNADIEGNDQNAQVRHKSERDALAEAAVTALRNEPTKSVAFAQLYADVTNPELGERNYN